MRIRIPPSWELPEAAVTPEPVYRSRRDVLKQLGLGGVGLGLAQAGCFLSVDGPTGPTGSPPPGDTGELDGDGTLYPAPRNEAYAVPERALTDEGIVTTYNNFYEFTTSKRVSELVGRFVTSPWSVEVTGLVGRPGVFDIDDLIRLMPLEERIYRLRCVEAWSATVPWTGFPFSALLDAVEPQSAARFVRLETVLRPQQMPGIDANPGYPWAYHEGLSLDEAMNELTLLTMGSYGKPLTAQQGAPVRLIVPWKYGYKNIKSIVRIELTDVQPSTFWNTLVPSEYDFVSNVDPDHPHPRWSQATEIDIGSNTRIDTLKYNGYEEQVGYLYA